MNGRAATTAQWLWNRWRPRDLTVEAGVGSAVELIEQMLFMGFGF